VIGHLKSFKFIRALKKGDLLLIDSGFDDCATFIKILRRKAHFIIPAKANNRPKALRTSGKTETDYLCQAEGFPQAYSSHGPACKGLHS
jgi:hypothetical protein